MATKRLTLECTEDQRNAILGFINSNNLSVNVTEEDISPPTPSTSEMQENQNPPMPQHIANETECQFCFCAPCIVSESNRQMWWPENNHQPCRTNACERKPLYRRFWAMLYNCGAWRDPRYIAKKGAARRGDTTYHKRELMPECVVAKCRQWYPNPEQMPYMGHKWV